MWSRIPIILCILLIVKLTATAQVSIRGQVYLPSGEPLRRQIRFTLSTDDQLRHEIFFTDPNGRITLPQIRGPYTITIESDGVAYDTTTVSFTPPHSGPYILIHLRPLKSASKKAGVVEVEQRVSPKAGAAYKLATDYIRAQEYAKAAQELKRAISIQPDFFRAHNDLGVVYLKLNRLSEALESFLRAIEIDNKNALPQFNLGLILNLQGKYEQATKVLSELQHTHPELTYVIPHLIEALIGARAWAQAEEELVKALALKDANVPRIRAQLGMVRLKLGKALAAVEDLADAVKADPDNAVTQLNFGAALKETGKLDEAEKTLLNAYRIGGATVAGSQLLLGMIYFERGNYPKAIEAFEIYLRDFPDAPNAADVKESIERLRRSAVK